MQKIHVGDVIENLHASENNPHRKGIVKLIYKDYIYMVTVHNGKLDSYSFYKRDVENDHEGWVVKGNVKLNVIIENILNKY